MTRTIAHGKRTGYASLGAGGLNAESFPMKLFLKGNARKWNPADKLIRRLGAIESARGADIRMIDRDASPEALEEKFHAEDQLALAT